MPKEKTIYQIYDLHLINGEVVSLAEEYDLPFDKGFIKEFVLRTLFSALFMFRKKASSILRQAK